MSEENIADSSSSNFSEQIHASPVAAAGSTVRPEELPVSTNQVIETKGEMAAQHKPPALNPWPHIEDFYILKSRNGQALTYHCVLCEPKEVIIDVCRSLMVKAQTLVKNWLDAGSKDTLTDAAFMGEWVFIDLFIKFNTAIPS